MFERYTEIARRVIVFARYEASQFGSPYIETEHRLLGLLREDKALIFRFLRCHASAEPIRKQIEGHTTIREKLSTSVDLPFDPKKHGCHGYCSFAPSVWASFRMGDVRGQRSSCGQPNYSLW